MSTPTGEERVRLARELFAVSVTKQAKLRALAAMIGDTRGKVCLDVGSDNGVISLLLRERGGEWSSADLDETTVAEIRALVGGRVCRIDGVVTPFGDASFDLVVIVDCLEHVPADREFVAELRRILRPGGRLVVNVPHVKPRSLVDRLRRAVGQTDELHGHVRPGYTVAGLRELLAPWFRIRETHTYSRAFSEILDTALRLAVDRAKRPGAVPATGPGKGSIVTHDDLARRGAGRRLVKLCYPALWLFSRLDALLFLQPGYKLVVAAETAAPLAERRGA